MQAMFDWFDILFIVIAIFTAVGIHLVAKESNFKGSEKLLLMMLVVSVGAIIAFHAFYLDTSIGIISLYDLPVGLAGIIIVYAADYFVGSWKAKKFKKITLASILVIIVFLSFAAYMFTPLAELTKIPNAGKTALKASPIKNEDGSITYNNVKPDVFNSMKMRLAGYNVQVPQGNEGDIEGSGIKVHFKWDSETNLTIIIKDNSCSYISNEMIIEKMTDFVQSCGGS